MTGPMRPEDAAARKSSVLPAEVFEVFNDLIASRMSGKSAAVLQKDVVDALVAKGFERDDIFARHLLDVEDAYRAAGWRVTYDKPAGNESYNATFTFSKS